MLTDLKRIIDQISRDKGIDRNLLVEAIEEAVRSAVRKKYGSRRDIEVQFNEEIGEIEVYQYRTVVDELMDEEMEISLVAAKELDPEAEIGDDLGEKLEKIADLGRIAAQSAKQVIIHRMRDAEREVIYDMFRDRQGAIVNGIVQRFERGNMVINLGRTDAVLPRDGQIPKRSFKQGDRIRAYLREVRHDHRDSQLILSRTCNEFLEKLFEMEVPEIAEGIVRIMGVSREPGFRAKIAVSSTESDVDPVGACVGLKGSRVQNVVQELQGERIDIVPWSPDPAKYVYNALAPAQVSMVIVDEDNNKLLVVVPNDQLSLAIGRQGQNVRLASRLMGWRIDVKSEQRYANLEDPEYQKMIALPHVDENLADKLFAKEITSLQVLSAADMEILMGLGGVDEKRAGRLKDAAAAALAMAPEVNEEEVVQPDVDADFDADADADVDVDAEFDEAASEADEELEEVAAPEAPDNEEPGEPVDAEQDYAVEHAEDAMLSTDTVEEDEPATTGESHDDPALPLPHAADREEEEGGSR